MIFGITGPTGAGKSTVSEMFRGMGVYVADADIAARRVTEKGTECLGELVSEFGREILNENGELNRHALGDIVFTDPKKLEILNAITHKYIKAYITEEIKNSGAELAAIDGAVIIGSPVMDMCDRLVVVTADREIRLRRIMGRDGLSAEATQRRIGAQPRDEEYIRYADYVIENNDKLQGEEIERICNEIKTEKKASAAAEAKDNKVL